MKTLQLQFWYAAARSYMAAPHCETVQSDAKDSRAALEFMADRARAAHADSINDGARVKSWRIADVSRPLKDPKHRAPRHLASGRTIAQVQSDYCAWAQSKGLRSIVAYRGKALCASNFSGRIDYITAEQQFAVKEWREDSGAVEGSRAQA